MISVVILTLNEEHNLAACLESVKWARDVVVFDSFSTDSTVEIAKAMGARVLQRKFDGYASQRNAALNLEFKNAWLLMLDADERVPDDLRAEMLASIKVAPKGTALFRMRRKDYFRGRWLRRSSGYPTWFGRLLRVGHVHVEREVNEEYRTDGQVGHLNTHLQHYPFSKGFQYWVERHNNYSTMEACALAAEAVQPVRYSGLFAGDPVARRKVAKQILYRLPFRPTLVFVSLLFVRGGIFDGGPGITFALLRAMYEYMINVKTTELRRRQLGLPF